MVAGLPEHIQPQRHHERGSGQPEPGVQVSLAVPEGWRLLPLDPAGRDLVRDGLAAQAQPEVLVDLVDEFTTAAAAQSLVLWATGPLDIAPGPITASALLGVRPAGAAPALDEQAEALGATGLIDPPSISIRRLPLAGPAARLAWTSGPAGGRRAPYVTCVQYCVPFPEDDRSALLLLSAAVPAGAPVASALDALAGSITFLDDDGTVVLPAAPQPA
jgi:hypothetical protein